MLEYKGFEVFCDGGGSVRVRDKEFTVAVDPSSGGPSFEAAIVLVTSTERGDLDRDRLKQVCGRGTCVVLPDELEGMSVPCPDVEFLSPGEAVDIYSVEISAMKSSEGLAYCFDMRGTSFFVSGDTEKFADPMEFENLVDLAFFSASESVDLEKAVRNAVKIKPDVVLPYLYSERSLDGFKAELEDRNIKCRRE
ncbi:MAG: hypothetical protein ABEJ36_04595 [Candidatus Nanosalina sp.]